MNWLKKPIFVSGATGFIGGRVCERLVQEGAGEVRTLVHDIRHAARIARLPVQLCPGDLLDRPSLRRALGDARVVIHLGLGYGSAIPRGTENLLEVARAAKVDRFVHVSTTAVYGLKPHPGSEIEEAPVQRADNPYCDGKRRAEKAVSRFGRRGLPTVILRPSIVCGPYSRWSTRLVEGLRQGQVALIDDGQGACNTTYVDNLVDAIFLALDNGRATGETFSITDGETVTWGDFIRAHAAMMKPRPELPVISTAQILAHYRAQPGLWASSFKAARQMLLSREFREMLRRIPVCERVLTRLWMSFQDLDEKWKNRLRARAAEGDEATRAPGSGQPVPDLDTWAIQTGAVYFRIDKARKLLGYTPRISFAQGMNLVEQWLRFADYLPA